MKRSGMTRILALCLAVISLSMLVSGGLGIRAANKERQKNESELQDLRSRIDEYRQISAALMDRGSYEDMSRSLEEKQKKYDADTARHRADLSTYTATNSGLEMGTAALNQAESALENGKTQYEMGLKALKSSLKAFNQIAAVIEPFQTQMGTIEELLSLSEKMLRSGDPDSDDPEGGSVYRLEQAIMNLCALIENELPAEENGGQSPENDKEGTTGEDKPAGESPEDPDPENPESEDPEPPETPEQNNPDPENQEQETPAPGDQEPKNPEAEKEPDLSDHSPPAAENTDIPLSPKTGEEKDLSGRLQEAVREVMAAANAVQEDLNTISEQAESLSIPPEILQSVLGSAGTSTVDELRETMIDAIHSADIVLTPEQGEALEQMLQVLSTADAMTDSVTEQMKELMDTAEAVDSNSDELIGSLGAVLEETEYHFTDAQLSAIRAAYMANKASIEEALGSAEDGRKDAYDTLQRVNGSMDRIFGLVRQLSGAKAKLDQTLTAMKEMGEEIEQGEAALAEGRAKLDEAKDEQKKKAEELDKKKQDLDDQEKALKQSSELAEEQKELEDREKTLRTALLAREEIRRRSQHGEELLSASEHWLTEYTEQTARRYRDRFDASLLMILCAVLALAGALTGFGKTPFRVLTVLLTLLCLAFSIAAAVLLYRMGRGISWSATVTALIAAAELVFLVPSLLFSNTRKNRQNSEAPK